MKDHFIAATLLDGKLTAIWNRPDFEHQLGKDNGYPDTWWISVPPAYFSQKQTWLPWIDNSTKRPCFSVSIQEQNYTKEKYGETQIRSSVSCTIAINGNDFYQFACNDISYALAKANLLISEIPEHPCDFGENLIGRRVYWRDQPGIITTVFPDGRVVIEADGMEEFNTISTWMTEEEKLQEAEENHTTVIEDILAPSIWWFRD